MTCPFCDLEDRLKRSLEMRIHRGEITHTYVETKQGWSVGVVAQHMDMHLDYTPEEASHIETLRVESIDTLNTAESLLQRMMGWLDELEDQKDMEGITGEWVQNATRLVAECIRQNRLISISPDQPKAGIYIEELLASIHWLLDSKNYGSDR